MVLSYQIQYNNHGTTRYISCKKYSFAPWFRFFCAVLAIVALGFLSGGDWRVTTTALENMAANLKLDIGVQEAFSQFCLDVLQGAQIG